MSETTIQDRLKLLREKYFGARGRRAFATALGISPSSYHRYEIDREMPIALAVKACELTGADLRWLLTGASSGPAPLLSAENQAILQRLMRVLEGRPAAAGALRAFLDLLEQHSEMGEQALDYRSNDAQAADLADDVDAMLEDGRFVPVLGRTAAGIPHFWQTDPGTVAELNSAFKQLSERPAAARGALADRGDLPVQTAGPAVLVQSARPCRVGDLSVTEFLSAGPIADRAADAFALRIDGTSMAPAYQDGDLVVVSPNQPARDGRPAVVQLQNQIGVTCKIYRRLGRRVHLIPINEQYQPSEHGADEVVWALEVLFRVRLK